MELDFRLSSSAPPGKDLANQLAAGQHGAVMSHRCGIWIGLTVLALSRAHAAPLAMEDCRLSSPWLPAVAAQCATLTVAENPAEPEGRQIDLFVARVPSLNATPRPDPLVLISGGPGQAASDLYLGVRGAFAQVRRDRDIVIVDQRGTGRSNPLTCDVAYDSVEVSDPTVLPRLMAQCLADMQSDPRFFTTSVAVQDLDRVRDALELDTWNIYGVSYGTRVALHYLRRFPDRARAVVLDGVIPPELALGPNIATNAQNALELVFARCAEQPGCSDRFPDLGARLENLSGRLEGRTISVRLPDPRTGAPVERALSQLHVKSVIRLMSYSPQTVALLPLLITEAYAGNYSPVTAQAYMMIEQLEAVLSVPMHNSVVCTEDVPFYPAQPVDLSGTYLGTSVVDALTAVCSIWPRGLIDDDLKTALVSDRPILLLSGEADPITPPDYGFEVLSNLSNARHLIGPGQGHAQIGVGCVPRLVRSFLDDPVPANLDAECLDLEGSSPFFLDFNGPAP